MKPDAGRQIYQTKVSTTPSYEGAELCRMTRSSRVVLAGDSGGSRPVPERARRSRKRDAKRDVASLCHVRSSTGMSHDLDPRTRTTRDSLSSGGTPDRGQSRLRGSVEAALGRRSRLSTARAPQRPAVNGLH